MIPHHSWKTLLHQRTLDLLNLYSPDSLPELTTFSDKLTWARTSFVRELRPPGTTEESTDWYNMCTETIGFESLANVSFAQSSLISSSSRLLGVMMRENMKLNDTPTFLFALDNNIPPINDLPTTSLSTLDDNGRPLFRFEQVRSDGRLTMTMFEKMPDIGRTIAKEILDGDQDINDNMPEIGLTVAEEIVNGDQANNKGAKNESERYSRVNFLHFSSWRENWWRSR
ncbi:hypothetical protein Patl1_01063 [Pistacia atlantica]|uniref:Uncharacterized protein n=1 Tax=Pistacia atlantica TaxID=434234 RepID=A0ACC1CDA6_9ROSI|nr:hypothetical protein Patl1_01063 [Pistacia atlantica]